jgi:hypothetical protein
MADKEHKEDEKTEEAATIFPLVKVKIEGRGTVTAPGGIRPNGKRVPLPEENDNG